MANVKKADRKPPLEHMYCVVCKEPIPDSRLVQKAVTCSKAHAAQLKNERRRRRDQASCHFCRRPCTPAEVASWKAWRATLPQLKRGRPAKPKPAVEETAPLANGAAAVEDMRTSGVAAQEERNEFVG